MESRSKFACLHIDDDSDEDLTTVVGQKSSSKAKTHNRSTAGGANQLKTGQELIVHAVEKRPRTKKANKEKVVDATTGLIVQDADPNQVSEQKYREDLKRGDQNTPPFGKVLRRNVDEPRKHSPSRNFAENNYADVIEFYKNKLAEAHEQLAAEKQEKESKQADLEKYTSRYRKLIDLFRESEISEKAKLLTDLERPEPQGLNCPPS
ncbi:hypothetical protein KIN20_035719 [Parelaphostrongylus tenuis]|uniref:Uncharacterized protein n=1 Tax=Parelaphostrongylus tenuis TaxID=148309 RepID=A0AAD5WL39_PARTN|nr:hypothetical protein KIN20_035719 [Parelaphostrongylus tenuis]